MRCPIVARCRYVGDGSPKIASRESTIQLKIWAYGHTILLYARMRQADRDISQSATGLIKSMAPLRVVCLGRKSLS